MPGNVCYVYANKLHCTTTYCNLCMICNKDHGTYIYVGVLLIAVLCDIYISNIMFINKKIGIRGYIVHDKLFNLVKQVIKIVFFLDPYVYKYK